MEKNRDFSFCRTRHHWKKRKQIRALQILEKAQSSLKPEGGMTLDARRILSDSEAVKQRLLQLWQTEPLLLITWSIHKSNVTVCIPYFACLHSAAVGQVTVVESKVEG